MPLARYASQFSQLAETGLIGVLSGHVPVSFAPALVDALLAAPVLIAQVQLNGPHALDLLADLRAQVGDLMLVGAEVPAGEGLLDEATAVDLALQAGAQFIVAPPTLAVALHRHETPTLPHFTSLSHLQQANPTNWSLLQASHLSPQDVLEWHTAVAGTQLIINTDPNSLRQVAAYRLAGAIALAVPLWQTGQDTIRPSIVKARAMSTAWQEAVKHGRD